jgi:hypothetical protein
MFKKEVLLKIEKNKRVYVFIDASNIWSIQKSKGMFLNFRKVIKIGTKIKNGFR